MNTQKYFETETTQVNFFLGIYAVRTTRKSDQSLAGLYIKTISSIFKEALSFKWAMASRNEQNKPMEVMTFNFSDRPLVAKCVYNLNEENPHKVFLATTDNQWKVYAPEKLNPELVKEIRKKRYFVKNILQEVEDYPSIVFIEGKGNAKNS